MSDPEGGANQGVANAATPAPVMSDVNVVAANFKRRLSGVTSTIIQLTPLQAQRTGFATIGPGLPDTLPKLRWWQVFSLLRRPSTKPFRIWHARRNPEMLAGIILRDIFRAPIKLVFTSASQRKHTAYTRWLLRRMDSMIATSAKGGTYLEVPYTVINHGIDCDRFSPAFDPRAMKTSLGLRPDERYIGCFGRIRHQKGTDLFVDAMIRLLPDHPGWSAIVAGRATREHQAFEAELRERVQKAGLADRILFVGEKTNIPDWYRALELYVAPQRWEGFGLTPLEAMATKVPVIATNVGAFSELVDEGKTGSIIPIGDVDAMVAATARLVADDTLREQSAEQALDRARSKFRIEVEVAALQQVYDTLWASGS